MSGRSPYPWRELVGKVQEAIEMAYLTTGQRRVRSTVVEGITGFNHDEVLAAFVALSQRAYLVREAIFRCPEEHVWQGEPQDGKDVRCPKCRRLYPADQFDVDLVFSVSEPWAQSLERRKGKDDGGTRPPDDDPKGGTASGENNGGSPTFSAVPGAQYASANREALEFAKHIPNLKDYLSEHDLTDQQRTEWRLIRQHYAGFWGAKVIFLALLTLIPVFVSMKIHSLGLTLGVTTFVYLPYHGLGAWVWANALQLRSNPQFYEPEHKRTVIRKMAKVHKVVHPLGMLVIGLLTLTFAAKAHLPVAGKDLSIDFPGWVYEVVGVEVAASH